MICIAVFTQVSFLKPLIDKTPGLVFKALCLMFSLFGYPKVLQSDNGDEFINSLLKCLENHYGWNNHPRMPYHPQTNGLVEGAVVRTTINVIRKHVTQQLIGSLN